MNILIIANAKKYFHQMIEDSGSDPFGLVGHLNEMEKWAHLMLKRYPAADQEVVLLGVWLHDIGHYPLPEEDHAVRGKERAERWLKEQGYDQAKADRVLHCVRAHRCRDVMPETLEAKIIAFIDSASHMTGTMYLDIARQNKEEKVDFLVFSKMERDYRDLAMFPEVQAEMTEIYEGWKKLLEAYEKFEL